MKTTILEYNKQNYLQTILKTKTMKKLLIFMLLFTGIVNAQIVNIPDANFKAKLIALGVDTNGDGNIQNSEAINVTSLNMNNSNISNLTGIRSFLNLQILSCNNNQLNTLNLSGLNNLIFLSCSNNQLTAINLSATGNINKLFCEFNQLTTLNVSNFSTLEELGCSNNLITSLNINSCPLLKKLICNNNQINSLNLNTNLILTDLICQNNLITNLDCQILASLQIVNCSDNQLTTINIAGLQNLYYFKCKNNLLQSIDLTNVKFLGYIGYDFGTGIFIEDTFDCSFNQISNFTFSNTQINSFDCSNNQLSSLDVSDCAISNLLNCSNNLLSTLIATNVNYANYLNCSYNHLVNFSLSNSIFAKKLVCSNNLFSTLDFSNVTLGQDLDISFNQLANVNFGNSTVRNIFAKNNPLTTIDISNCFNINSLDVSNNNLSTIFAKNGRNEFINFTNNPNLTFICADDEQVSSFASVALPTTAINSYCNFIPGGISNKIVGISRLDADNNGCNNLDFGFNNLRINVNDGIDFGSTFTNNTGNYSIFTQSLDYTLTPSLENPTYFNISPASSVVSFPTNNFLTQTQDFCVTTNGIRPDLEIVIFPAQQTIPYSEAEFVIVYKNKGNQVLSGTVDFTFNDDICDLTTSNPVADAQTSGLLNWNYSNLLPFESRSINLKFQLNDATFPFYLNLGDNLPVSATINPVIGDETPVDNTFSLNQPLVSTSNLNFITCLEGNNVAPSHIGKYLHYSVQFENAGTQDANNVVIKNVIDTNKFDINSLQVVSSTASLRTVITNSIVEFIFENINLARRSGTPPVGGHGDVLFKIKTNPTLQSGSSVVSNASIYFDYNMAILTNNAITTFATLNSQVFKIDESVSVSPNPTTSIINISSKNEIKSIELFDVQGRILETILNANGLDISNKTNGIYFLKITTEKGSKVEKVIKE